MTRAKIRVRHNYIRDNAMEKGKWYIDENFHSMHVVSRTRSRRDAHAWRREGGLKLAPV